MTIGLLDAGAAEQWRGRVNDDTEFRLIARDMTLNLAIEVGGEVPAGQNTRRHIERHPGLHSADRTGRHHHQGRRRILAKAPVAGASPAIPEPLRRGTRREL